ncbi:uncharacterized protein BYT42DRAFT_570144 [Radiomyces spectabilis]|uniref:uncharacterized protein n=1 Tax=Radiomyces spectabilis TaxID=64574 RepID=UPI0022209B0F|nr:uncharacterized protein BYT42DRAFT_570144 [Radiomyces spectabilis]KAI8377385.1 hypothetical protein BYT42DRAFT_570144 [Radiomyces spectabilis]
MSEKRRIRDVIERYVCHCRRRNVHVLLSQFIVSHFSFVLQSLPGLTSPEDLKHHWTAHFRTAVCSLDTNEWELDTQKIVWTEVALKKKEFETQQKEKEMGFDRKRKTVDLFNREHEFVGLELENQQTQNYIPESSKKRKVICDEIDEFFNLSSPEIEEQRTSTEEDTHNSEAHDKSSNSDRGDVKFNHTETPTLRILLSRYEEAYKAMDNARKWTLSTGKVVEDAVYYFGKRCTEEHLSHSFVIDISDAAYISSGTFTQDEINEIARTNSKPTPEMPEDLHSYIQTYRQDNVDDLRRAIFSPQTWDQDFKRRTHFDHDWVRQSVYNIVTEYEAYNFMRPHLEQWYNIHVWRLFDKCFEIIPNVEIARGESPSQASGERKNKTRTVPGMTKIRRQFIGRRVDFAVRKHLVEYGCGEVGLCAVNGENTTKLMIERGLKAPKIMRDMFMHLSNSVGNNEQVIRSLETVALVHKELDVTMLRLDSPRGYICRVMRTATKRIPREVGMFSKVLAVIVMAWTTREIVRRVMSVLESYDDDEDLRSSCRPALSVPAAASQLILPETNTTPNNARNRMR